MIKKTSTIVEDMMNSANSINRPIEPRTLGIDIVSILNNRLHDEYTAYYFYLNASNWCLNKGYNFAGKFFANESDGEKVHAKKIEQFLIDWNQMPDIPKVETSNDFESLVEIINEAYKLEYNLLQKYSEDVRKSIVKDVNAFVFLQQFIQIQNDEVKEYSDLLNALLLIDPADKYQLLYFENNYFKG